MSRYDIVIIGGGLGGLECGLILSKEGMRVCVLEQHHKPGGNLQSFTRDNCIFDTGMHYVGSMCDGQYLHKYMKYFGITDRLRFKQLDTEGFDTISFDEDDRKYMLSQGDENFVSGLKEQFPGEGPAIEKYLSEIKSVTDNFPLFDLKSIETYHIPMSILGKCSGKVLDSLTKNERLKNVLAGALAMYHGKVGATPFYIHACMRDSLISSCWRPIDGSQQIADLLAEEIKKNGGHVFTSKTVKEIQIENNVAEAVLIHDGEKILGDHFISNAHPVTTLKMIPDGKVKQFYRKRIYGMENSWGAFIVYGVFKKDSFPYLNKNYFHYNKDGILKARYDDEHWPDNYYFYTPASSNSEEYANCFIIMTDMKFDEVRQWQGTSVNNRGEEYKDFKAARTEQLLNALEKRFPHIRSKIQKTYSSSPLTFMDYTSTYEGSAYGILKDCHNPLRSLILPRTKISNLYFTGQNLNLHGILGVTAGAVITCSEIIGLKHLTNKIVNG